MAVLVSYNVKQVNQGHLKRLLLRCLLVTLSVQDQAIIFLRDAIFANHSNYECNFIINLTNIILIEFFPLPQKAART